MPETVIGSCSIVVSAGKLCFNRPIKDDWQLKGKREERKVFQSMESKIDLIQKMKLLDGWKNSDAMEISTDLLLLGRYSIQFTAQAGEQS